MSRLSSSVTTSATMVMANILRKEISQSNKRLESQEKSTSLARSATKKSNMSTFSANKSSRNDIQNISLDSSIDVKNSSRSSKIFLKSIYSN